MPVGHRDFIRAYYTATPRRGPVARRARTTPNFVDGMVHGPTRFAPKNYRSSEAP